MPYDRLFVLQVVVAIEEQWFAERREGSPTRIVRKHRIDDFLFAAADEDDAFRIISEWLRNDVFSDSNHDGEGDLTRIFAIGIHQLEEVARVSKVREQVHELYGIALPGFYLGDVDAAGVPLLRQRKSWRCSGSDDYSTGVRRPHDPPMQWTVPAGKLPVVPESARCRLGH